MFGYWRIYLDELKLSQKTLARIFLKCRILFFIKLDTNQNEMFLLGQFFWKFWVFFFFLVWQSQSQLIMIKRDFRATYIRDKSREQSMFFIFDVNHYKMKGSYQSVDLVYFPRDAFLCSESKDTATCITKKIDF